MGAFNFKDYSQIYTSIDDRSAEQRLAAHVLYTFIVDAKKISRDLWLANLGRTKSRKNKYAEWRTPTIKEFLRDLNGESCKYYCDVLNYDYLDFVKRIRLLLPESLIKK